MKKQSWPFLPLFCAGFLLVMAAVFLCRTVPRPGVLHRPGFSAQAETLPTGTVSVAVFPIDVNSASAEELTHLPGIGPSLAQAIVAHREKNGPFDTPEDLLEVSGIGQTRLEQMLPYITTGG